MPTATISHPPEGLAPPLLSMPVEVLCAIFFLLDPISLIAAAQTSRALRAIIDPARHDFVQRLLALELLPGSGGIVPRFRSRDSTIAPPTSSPEWRRNKYACSLCLKLRSHMYFNNHSILRLQLRKPPPGSREAIKLTTWEPLELRDPATRHKRARQRAAADKVRLAPERAAYHQYRTRVGLPPRDPFRRNFDFDYGPADKSADELEKALCGTERHKRACNPCRHLRGDLSHPGRALGRPDAPIVKSRRVSRHHVLERHFPGLLDFFHERSPDPALAPPATYPRGFRYFNIDRRYKTWTLYTAYCGSCTQWHELAGFGYYAWSPREMPTVPLADPKHPSIPLLSLCHQCSQREDPSGFSQRLARAAIQSANVALKAVDFRLAWGWNSLYKHFTDQELKPVGRAGTPILHGLPWKGRTDKQMYPKLDLGEDMIPELRVRLERLQSCFSDELPSRVREMYGSDRVFKMWLDDHRLNEAVYLQITKAITMMEEQPGLVEMYIAEREPYRL